MSLKEPERVERARQWMMAALDGELSEEDRTRLEKLLADDANLRKEWDEMRDVKGLTQKLAYNSPPDEIWDGYWVSVYNRLERGIGWILASVGFLMVTGYGIWMAAGELLSDPEVPLPIRIGLPLLAFGALVLLISVLREKLRVRKSDPFKEVQR